MAIFALVHQSLNFRLWWTKNPSLSKTTQYYIKGMFVRRMTSLVTWHALFFVCCLFLFYDYYTWGTAGAFVGSDAVGGVDLRLGYV